VAYVSFSFLMLGALLPAAARAPKHRRAGSQGWRRWIYNKLEGWNNVLEDISVVRVKRVGRGIFMEATRLDGNNPT
jgi:hypothetical protein